MEKKRRKIKLTQPII